MSTRSITLDEAPDGGAPEPSGEVQAEAGGASGPRRELRFDGYDVVADAKVVLSPVVIVDAAQGGGRA